MEVAAVGRFKLSSERLVAQQSCPWRVQVSMSNRDYRAVDLFAITLTGIGVIYFCLSVFVYEKYQKRSAGLFSASELCPDGT